MTSVADSAHPLGTDPAVIEAVFAVRQSNGIARLDDYRLYEVGGPDAVRFLQNRLSNDVLTLDAGQGQLNAALDRQGKIEGVFSLHRLGDELFYLLAHQDEAESTVAGIEKYHIVEQFTIKPIADTMSILACQGPQSLNLLESLLDEPCPLSNLTEEYDIGEGFWQGSPLHVIRRSMTGETGYLLLVTTSKADELYRALQDKALSLGGVEMNSAVREVLRVEAGLPRLDQDYNHETLLPETGLERQAVSYSKGCYLGQETIARIKTYGMVQKALIGLLFEPNLEALPPKGTICLLDGKPVGTIQSAVYSPTIKQPIAMAYLGKAERIPGNSLTLEVDGKHLEATVTLLPFYDCSSVGKSGRVLLDEGLRLFSDGYDNEAIRLLSQAIESDSTLIEAYEALGVILSRQDRFDEAIALMEKVLLLDPEHVLAHTNLSVFYMKKGDIEKAEAEKAKATMAAFSRKAKEAGLMFDIEAEQRKKEQALLEKIEMFQEALRYNPDDPLGNFGLGSALIELKRYAEAVSPLEKVIQTQPRHSVAYLTLGKALEGLEKKQEALGLYRQGIEVAAAKGDLMPLKEMQSRLEQIENK